MEVVFSDKRQDVLRFDPDEDAVLSLVKHVLEEKISAAWISGLGSAREVELGFYDKYDKEYRRQVFNEEMEGHFKRNSINYQLEQDLKLLFIVADRITAKLNKGKR